MKRRILALLLAVLTLAALTTAAFAADADETGVYCIRMSTGYKLTVKDASSVKGFYANATEFELSCQNLSGQYSMVFLINAGTGKTTPIVPTDTTLYYIDQKNIEATTTFKVMPKALDEGTYHVYVTTDGNNGQSLTKVASFDYGKNPGYMLGDADGSGDVNTNDAVAILLYVVEKYDLTGTKLLAANVVDSDGVNTNDAVAILLHVVGKYDFN